MSIGNTSWKANLLVYCNWDRSTPIGSGELDFSSTVHVEDYQVISGEANCVSYEINNSSTGDDILITGFEVQYEPTQQSPKGDT